MEIDNVKTAVEKVENLEWEGNDGNIVFANAGKTVTRYNLNKRVHILDVELRRRDMKLMLFGKGSSLYDIHATGDGIIVGIVIVDIDGPDTEHGIEVEK